jgi:hypothetical protein
VSTAAVAMRKILIGCALAAGMFVGLPMTASAQSIGLEIGRDGLRLNDGYQDGYYRDGYYRDGYYRADRRSMRPICTEGRALGKAERMGIRRARIADVGRRTIEVRGRDRSGDRIYVTFGRSPSCPVLS